MMRAYMALAGEVVQVRIRISGDIEEYGSLIEAELVPQLRAYIDEQVTDILGPDFSVSYVEVRRGSIEIIAAIATAYTLIASYKSFCESLDLLRTQITALVAKLLGGSAQSAMFSVSWQPIGTFRDAVIRAGEPNGATVPVPRGVLTYLLVTHGLLIVAAIMLALDWSMVL